MQGLKISRWLPPGPDYALLETEQSFDAGEVMDELVCRNEADGREVLSRQALEPDQDVGETATWEMKNGDHLTLVLQELSAESLGSAYYIWVAPPSAEEMRELAEMGGQLLEEEGSSESD